MTSTPESRAAARKFWNSRFAVQVSHYADWAGAILGTVSILILGSLTNI